MKTLTLPSTRSCQSGGKSRTVPATRSRSVPRQGAENQAANPTSTAPLSANQAQTA